MLRQLFNLFPFSYLSAVFGWFAALELPQPLRRMVIGSYARMFRVDLREATQTLEQFKSLAELFVRDLTPGARPIGEGLVSPVDGTLRSCGVVRQGFCEQVKGMPMGLRDLLGSDVQAELFTNGLFINSYLSPRDYHHIHAPYQAQITSYTILPGKLWPVSNFTVNRFGDLLARNLRVVIHMESNRGSLALVMIGATNVGAIELHFAPLLTVHANRREAVAETVYLAKPMAVEKGERIGTFNLGSAVVVFAQANQFELLTQISSATSPAIRYGQPLAAEHD